MTTTYALRSDDGPLLFSRKFALLEPLTEHDYTLQEEFWVWWKEGENVYRIRVPKGFVTDIASIPRWVWTFSGLTPDGLYRNAAVIHDWLYMWQGKLPSGSFQVQGDDGDWHNLDTPAFDWNRDQCDRMFLRIMKACDVEREVRTKMYWSVKLFGWIAWMQTDKTKLRYKDAFNPSATG